MVRWSMKEYAEVPEYGRGEKQYLKHPSLENGSTVSSKALALGKG